jgi:hypothetical protein
MHFFSLPHTLRVSVPFELSSFDETFPPRASNRLQPDAFSLNCVSQILPEISSYFSYSYDMRTWDVLHVNIHTSRSSRRDCSSEFRLRSLWGASCVWTKSGACSMKPKRPRPLQNMFIVFVAQVLMWTRQGPQPFYDMLAHKQIPFVVIRLLC